MIRQITVNSKAHVYSFTTMDKASMTFLKVNITRYKLSIITVADIILLLLSN